VIERGWRSFIAFGRSENRGPSKSIKIGGSLDQSIHLASTRLFDRHGFHSTSATRKLVDQIESLKPDIIHLHNLHGYFLNVEVLFNYLKDFRGPIVWTLHDCWPFTGHCCHFERINCLKWQEECHHCELKWLYPQSYLLDNSSRNFNKKKSLFTLPNNLSIVTVSRWLEDKVGRSFLRGSPVSTIYNGIDLNIFKPDLDQKNKNLPGIDGKIIILGVANVWSEGKGLQTFLDLSQIIDSNFQILLVGLDEKQIRNLPPNITGFPRTASPEELAEFYNMADVFVNPSIAETFGVVTAESLACGTPVAGYNTSSMPELINKKVGRLADLNDVRGLYGYIKEIVAGGKAHYSANCREYAERYFNKESQYDRYFDLYQSLLKQGVQQS
jgi:putative colanic acid biosynthesis glycosyltransferase